MADPRYRTKRWRNLKTQAHRRDGYRCVIPGCKVDTTPKHSLYADHIIEVRDGGAFWDLNNLQTLCYEHHNAKTADVRAQRGNVKLSPNG